MRKKIKGRVGGIKIDSIVYTPEKKLLAVPLAEQGCMASPTTTKKTISIFMVKISPRLAWFVSPIGFLVLQVVTKNSFVFHILPIFSRWQLLTISLFIAVLHYNSGVTCWITQHIVNCWSVIVMSIWSAGALLSRYTDESKWAYVEIQAWMSRRWVVHMWAKPQIMHQH